MCAGPPLDEAFERTRPRGRRPEPKTRTPNPPFLVAVRDRGDTPASMESVRTLLAGILDFAGLFPPASLAMGPTVRGYADLRGGEDAWLAGRLVVPVARLDEFEREASGLLPAVPDRPDEDDDAWAITALTAAAGDEGFARDLAAIDAFNERHAGRGAGAAVIDSIEVRAASAAEIDRALDLLPDELYPYFEFPAGIDPRGCIAALAGLDAGAKIRTGGTTADAHPSVEAVAAFIAACAAAEVPFKATAGLHHPLRHHASSVGCRQHGFLNVFLGAALRWHGAVDDAALIAILGEERADAFRFAEDGAGWGSARLTLAHLRAARERFAHSFGSCSYAEPLADLRGLGLLRSDAATRQGTTT